MSKTSAILSRIMNIRPIQRQSIISLFWQIALTGIGFLSTMYFAHTIGSAILGSYFLFIAYLGVFGLFVNGGFGGAATKRISEGVEPDAYFSAYFIIRFVFTIIVIGLLVIFRKYFVDLNSEGMFAWLLLALGISIFAGPISSGVAGTGKIGIRTTCTGIDTISRFLIQIIAVFLGFEAAGLAAGAVAGTVVAVIIEFRYFDLHFARFKWSHIRSLSEFSFWLFLTSGGALVFSQADVVFIGYYLSNSDVGVYRVVLQLTMIATFTTYALRTTLWPSVSRWGKSGSINLVETSLERAITYSLMLAIPTFIGGVLLGKELLFFFYGAEFARGYTILVILLAVQVANVFQFIFTMYLNGMNYPKESFKATIIAVIMNIALNIILIPIMGISGAAIATLITIIINVLLAQRALSRIIAIRFDTKCLLNITLASGVMGVIIGGIRTFVQLSNVWLTLLTVLAGGAVYCVLILKLDKKIKSELEIIVDGVGLGHLWPKWM